MPYARHEPLQRTPILAKPRRPRPFTTSAAGFRLFNIKRDIAGSCLSPELFQDNKKQHQGYVLTHLNEPIDRRRAKSGLALERVPIKWNHLIDKDSLKIKELEHVLIEKVEQLFWDMHQHANSVRDPAFRQKATSIELR